MPVHATSRRPLVLGFAVLLVACGLLAAAAGAAAKSGSKLKPGTFVVHGDVAERLKLTVADLEALLQVTMTVTFRAGTTIETRTERGPLLRPVLELAGPEFDPDVRNDKLRFYVSSIAWADYAATIAWGELDPDFGNKQIILSVEEDGQSLADVGPRLIVPGDIRGGRYVSAVRGVLLARSKVH